MNLLAAHCSLLTSPGFSLIEVLVASAIIATSVGALFSVAAMSIRLTMQGQDRIVASQFAREGIEVARQIRDVNFVSGECGINGYTCKDWYTGLFDTAGNIPPVARGIDTNAARGFALTPKIDVTTQETCTDYVYRNVTTGAIAVTHSISFPNASDQLFCRRLYFEPVDIPETAENETTTRNAIRVRSQVTWTGYGKNTLRKPGTNGSNPCLGNSTEWCTEQVSLLTNWRIAQ